MLTELKNLDVRRPDLSELVELSAYARSIEAEFEAVGVETPEWLAVNSKSIRREIKSRNQDRIAEKLRSAKSRLENLKTPDEKRTGLQTEIDQLEKQLAEA